MTRSTNDVWLHRFAGALALATLFLVALGGVVTTKGVGMAVPDWPRTYGDHMFFFPPSKWMAGIFDEHVHRLWASLVGILAAAFAIWVWARDTAGRQRWMGIAGIVVGLALVGVRTPAVFVVVAVLCVGVIAFAIPRAARTADRLRWLGVILFAAVIIQGVLGGLRVLLDEYGWGTEFGIFHALLAQIFFLFICSLVLVTSNWWAHAKSNALNLATSARLKFLFLSTTILIFIQIFLGAAMRHQHQGLAVPDFPLAYGKLWPATDANSVLLYNARRLEAFGEQAITPFHIVVHMLHRYTGMAAFLAMMACAVSAWRNTSRGSALRRVSALWVGLGVVQVVLGIVAILSQRKVDVTTAHVAVGALTFMLGWIGVLVISRLSAPQGATVAATERVMSSAELKHA